MSDTEQPEAVKPRAQVLDEQRKASGEEAEPAPPAEPFKLNPMKDCEIVFAPWGEHEHWYCKKCSFSTFDSEVAKARAVGCPIAWEINRPK